MTEQKTEILNLSSWQTEVMLPFVSQKCGVAQGFYQVEEKFPRKTRGLLPEEGVMAETRGDYQRKRTQNNDGSWDLLCTYISLGYLGSNDGGKCFSPASR